MTENLKDQITRRMTINFLDIMVLRLLKEEPMWGYKIIKKTEKLFGIKPRHSAIYPLLNSLEDNKLLKSKKITKSGRVRKIYEISSEGIEIVNAYYSLLKQQLHELDIKEE